LASVMVTADNQGTSRARAPRPNGPTAMPTIMKPRTGLTRRRWNSGTTTPAAPRMVKTSLKSDGSTEPATPRGYRAIPEGKRRPVPAGDLGEVVSHAVWLYRVFSLSLRDVGLILAKRGTGVTHESVRRWCLKLGRGFADRLRRRRTKPGDTWHLDWVFIRINGVLHCLWRAMHQHGATLDILVRVPHRSGLEAAVWTCSDRRGPPRLTVVSRLGGPVGGAAHGSPAERQGRVGHRRRVRHRPSRGSRAR
jgi:hypothetical protein